MKFCPACKEIKAHSGFYRDRARKDGLRSKCKPCAHAAYNAYRKKTGYDRKRYQKIKPQERERHLVKKYGLTLADYDEMLIAQNNACAICGKKQHRAFDVDHCHQTGRIRGLLCGNCNRAIGYAGDDPDRLEAAAIYIRKSSKKSGTPS